MNELLYEFLKRISWDGNMNMEYCRDCSSLKKKHKYNDIIKKYYDFIFWENTMNILIIEFKKH